MHSLQPDLIQSIYSNSEAQLVSLDAFRSSLRKYLFHYSRGTYFSDEARVTLLNTIMYYLDERALNSVHERMIKAKHDEVEYNQFSDAQTTILEIACIKAFEALTADILSTEVGLHHWYLIFTKLPSTNFVVFYEDTHSIPALA